MNAGKHHKADSIALEDLDTIFFPKIKDPEAIAKIVQRTQSWTADNLFLTQLIYRYIRQYSAQIIQTEGPDSIVDEIVRQKIVKNWRTNEAAHLLCRIEQTLHSFDCQDTLMVLYLQILWRKGIAANAQPKLKAEQAALIQSELVTLTQGQLHLSNRIYATVFGMDWIEQQLPGLTTRTVSTPMHADISKEESHHQVSRTSHPVEAADIETADIETADVQTLDASNAAQTISGDPEPVTRSVRAPKFVKSASTAILIVSGVASLGLVTLGYVKTTNGFGATAQPLSTNTQIQDRPETILTVIPQQNPAASTVQASDPKILFDQGLAHATNGRWLPMAQQFCSIPPTSPYFASAKSQVERWVTLYPQNIQQANSAFLTTQNAPCNLLEEALKSVQ